MRDLWVKIQNANESGTETKGRREEAPDELESSIKPIIIRVKIIFPSNLMNSLDGFRIESQLPTKNRRGIFTLKRYNVVLSRFFSGVSLTFHWS